MDKKDVGGIILEGGIEGLVMSLLHSFAEVAKEKGSEYLKSKIFGLGTNDEHLFLSACAYAVKEKGVTSQEIAKICRAIDSFKKSQRDKIIETIGKDEIEVSSETPKIDKDGNVVTDKKTGKPVMTKTTSKANVKGAEMLAMMAKMNPTGIKQILGTSGASASFIVDLKKKVATATATIEGSQIKRDGDTLFGRETWLERVAREARERNNTI
jgi:hypothetical protein